MKLSKSARRKMRRYRRQQYFQYLDDLLSINNVKAFAREVQGSVNSPKAISLFEYVADRRRKGKLARMDAEVAAYIWEHEIRSLIPFWAKRCQPNGDISGRQRIRREADARRRPGIFRADS